MAGKILVAYATKYGASEGIAEKIGVILGGEGFDVEVIAIVNIKDLTSYDAVVLGSGVYIGKWRKEAAKFLKNHEQDLKEQKVWLFSSGPTGEGDPATLLNGWTFPEGLRETAESIGPIDTAVFSGAIDKDKLRGLEKWMLKKVEAGIGDFRDWEMIEGWARSIAKKLTE